MAKHTIDIIEGVKNFSQMKLFTINNPSLEKEIFSSDGLLIVNNFICEKFFTPSIISIVCLAIIN